MKTLLDWLDRLSTRHVILGLAVVVALVLQGAVFPHLAVYGLKPDLVMVVVACWALLYGPVEGFVAGLAAGLAQDLVFGRYIGLFALAKTLTGFSMGVIEGQIFKETIWVPTATVGVAVFVHEIIVWISLRGLGVRAPAMDVVSVGLPVAFYSMILAPLIYRQLFLYRVAERAKEKELTGGASQTMARR